MLPASGEMALRRRRRRSRRQTRSRLEHASRVPRDDPRRRPFRGTVMSASAAARPRVTLRVGGDMSADARATVMRLLLDRGCDVSTRTDEGIAGEPEVPPDAFAASLLDRQPPIASAPWKPWFPVIDYTRC